MRVARLSGCKSGQHRGPSSQECAVEMNCDKLLPIREWEIDDGMDYLDSSVAQEDIDRTEFSDDAFK